MAKQGCFSKVEGYVDLNKKLLPDRDGCKRENTQRWCHCWSCFKKGDTTKTDKALFGCGDAGTVYYNGRQQCCALILAFFFVYIFLFGIIQFICMHWAIWSCGNLPSTWQWVDHAATGVNTGGPSINILPQKVIIKENTPTMWGYSMDVYKKNVGNTFDTAPEGIWQRTWGPWFSTYVFQENQYSHQLIYMRPTILGMWFYAESVAMRCDGEGEALRFTEGSNWIRNRIRTLFRANQGSTFWLYHGETCVGKVEETGAHRNSKSAVFYNTSENGAGQFASAVYRHELKEWILLNNDNTSLPFYLTNAVTTLYAFHVLNAANHESTTTAAPNFLAETVDEEEEHIE